MVITKTENHPKPSETTQNHPKPFETTQSFLQPTNPGISYNQSQTTRISQQSATKCIWLILSSKILELWIFLFSLLLFIVDIIITTAETLGKNSIKNLLCKSMPNLHLPGNLKHETSPNNTKHKQEASILVTLQFPEDFCFELEQVNVGWKLATRSIQIKTTPQQST